MKGRLGVLLGIVALAYACTGNDPLPVAAASLDGGSAPIADGGAMVDGDGGPSPVVWSTTFGSAGNDRLLDAKVDGEGNVYLLGYTGGAVPGALEGPTVDPVPLAGAYFVARVTADGRVDWVTSIATVGDASLVTTSSFLNEPHLALAATRVLLSMRWSTTSTGSLRIGNATIAGGTPSNDTAVAALAMEDGRTVASTNIEADNGGNVELLIGAGSLDSALLFGRLVGPFTRGGVTVPVGHVLFAMPPALSAPLFWKQLDGSGPVVASDVTSLAATARAYVTGRVSPGRILPGETKPPAMADGSEASFITSVSGAYLGGPVTTRLSPPPTRAWHVLPEAAAVTPKGIAVVGRFEGAASFGNDVGIAVGDASVPAWAGYVALVGLDGKPVAARALLEGDADRHVRRVVRGADGTVVVGSTFTGAASHGDELVTSAGATDGIVTVYDAALAPTRTFHLGGPGADAVTGVGVAPDGSILVAGELTGEVVLPDGQRMRSREGLTSLYVLRLRP